MKRLLLIPILFLGFGSSAQVPMAGTGNYTQNFNTLANTGTGITWVNNTTIANWYAQRTGTGTLVYDAGAGASNSGRLFSFGSTSAPERSLGSLGSNSAGDFAIGTLFQNTSLGNIETITISYTMEQWRDGGATTPAAQSITFWYKTSTTSITDLTPNSNATWTQVTALTGSSPIFTNTAAGAALDGNLTANKVSLSNVVIPGLVLAPGEYLLIKWDDPNQTGNDHGLSIDDLTISWTAAAAPCTNTTATIDTVSCAASYTVPSGDEMYNVGGTYMDTIPNANGCDSVLTINLSFVTSINYYPDTDGDGFGDNAATAVPACTPPADHVSNNNDCDDTDPAIGLGITYYEDADGDGYGDATSSTVLCTPPTSGYATNDDDCDDTNPAIGVPTLYYVDADTDGYGDANATGVPSCTVITGSVTNNTDCNDNNAAAHPGATEIPNNGIDEDCNGSDLNTLGTTLGMYQFQGNTCPLVTSSLDVTTQPANATFSAYSAVGSTLNCQAAADVFNFLGFDTVNTVNLTKYFSFTITPAACYGMDLNRIIFTHKTSGSGETPIVHLRSSLDNFAADIATKQLLNSVYKTDTINLGAAFDNVASAIEFRWYITEIGAPGATYRHDDVTVIGNINALPTQTYYEDADGDGFGNPAVSQTSCSAPTNFVVDNTDCDDTDEEEFPGAVWYADTDGDGLGDAGSSMVSCLRPADHVSDSTDCNDNDILIGAEQTYYVDADIDGFGDANATGVTSCTPIAGSVTNNDDCDDDDEDINPSATEVCDGVDNDCDGDTDEGFTMMTYYEDADADTYGNPLSSVTDCVQPIGYVTNDDDCNDTIATVHPGAVDVLGNGIDDNCDGVIDGYLGIEETILANLSVYPNPGTSSVVLNMNNGWNGFKVTFASVDGKEISLTSAQKSANELEFNTESVVPGVYFIRLTSTEGTALVRWVKN